MLNNPALVATVDELMAPCTGPDSRLASTANNSRLPYDLLAEALGPVDVREMGAAE